MKGGTRKGGKQGGRKGRWREVKERIKGDMYKYTHPQHKHTHTHTNNIYIYLKEGKNEQRKDFEERKEEGKGR